MRAVAAVLIILSACRVEFDLSDARMSCRSEACEVADATAPAVDTVADDELETFAPDDVDEAFVLDTLDTREVEAPPDSDVAGDDNGPDVSLDERSPEVVIVMPLLSASPVRGPRGTSFTQTGAGFTPAGAVTLHFQVPDLTTTSRPLTADAEGAFEHVYDSTGAGFGTYRAWAVDDTTQLESDVATWVVAPTVTISPSIGPPGTSFLQRGLGFSPHATAQIFLRTPADPPEQAPVAIELDTDWAGNFTRVFDSAEAPLGDYLFWAIDAATGAVAETATFTMVAP